jgi:hypothetical protein
MEGVPKQFSSPEEEINFLRDQLAQKEREVLDRAPDVDDAERVTVAKEQLKEYSEFTPRVILEKNYQLKEHEVASSVAQLETSHDPVEDIIRLAQEKGIKNALTVLDKTENAYVVDEVHRRLIEQLHTGASVADLEEGVPPWHMLHMTLYEVALPAPSDGQERPLTDLVTTMQQLFAGLRIIGSAKHANHFAIEIAVANESDNVVFYVAVPDEFKSLFQKQVHSLFPNAVLTEQVHDYNVYVNGGATLIADVTLNKFYGYPLQSIEEFSSDPLAVILNAFSKMQREGEGSALQFVVRHPTKKYRKRIEDIIKKVEKGEPVKQAITNTTVIGEITSTLFDLFSSKGSEQTDEKVVDSEALELFRKKIESELVEVNIRLVVSAGDATRAQQMMQELKASLAQFDTPNANTLKINVISGRSLLSAQKAFSFRQFNSSRTTVLSLKELATIVHLPGNGILSTPEFKQSYSKTAPAPSDMPITGTLLGLNKHRGQDREIYVSEADRMRHFYVIGQTGTGKSVFLQNLIVQDIQAGAGVCMIDPHGTDIQEVMGAIPKEREQDVIYFDPSYLERSIGLNMLEYDPNKPEQKTFIVNELLSIFQKLYGANPESMGPMFEQYFRNATMLVMEDPESGNTLMDIGRVMADAKFRREKLAKATNPTVVQFWKEIAGKAGGEASLENIVPYIVSKIDPLTANDYIRPIIGQQHSAFNFRQLMDERKILLVNLSKGRLGEINANLIGMIFVGKILMAALSRVDDPTKSFSPFFLHIDEFQNVSTPSIAAILSEARKYKLGLTVAHQFIAQLDPVIRDAVFGNVGSLAAFRVGNDDANALEPQFAPTFEASDIMNTPNYNAVMRVLSNGTPTQAFSVATMPPPASDPALALRLIEESYARYGRPREEIEADIQARYQRAVPGVPPAPRV